MYDWWQLVLLALIQGLSEFLPISSSAHLVLPAQLFGWADQGLPFDVAVHMGTLIAVLAYFRQDLRELLAGLIPGRDQEQPADAELWKFAVATIPTVVAGVVFNDLIANELRGLGIIAATTLLFGLLLGAAAWQSRARVSNGIQPISWRDAALIGCAQALALVPGVSRSGVTITAALMLGYNAITAARFSFLLSIPIILGAMAFMSAAWLAGESQTVPLLQLLVAMVMAGVSAYATIALFLGLLDRIGLMPFVIYRLVLGAALVLVIFLA